MTKQILTKPPVPSVSGAAMVPIVSGAAMVPIVSGAALAETKLLNNLVKSRSGGTVVPSVCGDMQLKPAIDASVAMSSLCNMQTQSRLGGVATQNRCANAETQSEPMRVSIAELPPQELIQLEQHAIKGLVKCVKGYVLKEVKSTYELNADGDKQIKSEVVTQKQVAPEFAAIVFTLTNINPQRWRAKPIPEKDETSTEEELIDLSGFSEEQLTALLGQNGQAV